MQLWVGLGNPGAQYSLHRHNVGFMALDTIAEVHDFGPWQKKFRSLVAEGRLGRNRILLVKPQTFMNESGDAVASVQRFYRVEPARVIAVHDDVDLEPGRVRIRRGGRGGGNRGIDSMIVALGDPGFVRVKVGVGRPPAGPVPPNWVLSVPPAPERAAIEAAEERAADAVELLLAEGPERAMNRINQKEAPHGGPPL
jgi:peptidyl-tRNA hydrolase, PTH1 family